MPFKIDPLTLSLYHGRYARILVDVDLFLALPEKILVKMIDVNNNLDIFFFIQVVYKTLPQFCTRCATFNHATMDCNKEQIGWDLIIKEGRR